MPSFLISPIGRWLAISLAGNAALATAFVLTLRNSGSPKPAPAAEVTGGAVQTLAPAAPESSAISPSKTAFRWSDLDSPDFEVFVSRLRAIGCPEATIRDIVQGEVREIYAEKRREIEQRENPGGKVLVGALRSSLERELEELRREESQAIHELMMTPEQRESEHATLALASQVAAAEIQSLQAAARPPIALSRLYAESSKPAASDSMSPSAIRSPATPAYGTAAPPGASPSSPGPQLALNESQQEAVQRIQEKFVEDVGGGQMAPDAPEYLDRWLHAQAAADAMLQAQVGWQDFNRMQMEAAQADYEARLKSTTK